MEAPTTNKPWITCSNVYWKGIRVSKAHLHWLYGPVSLYKHSYVCIMLAESRSNGFLLYGRAAATRILLLDPTDFEAFELSEIILGDQVVSFYESPRAHKQSRVCSDLDDVLAQPRNGHYLAVGLEQR